MIKTETSRTLIKVKQKDQVCHVSRSRLFCVDNHEKLLNRKMDHTSFFLLMP